MDNKSPISQWIEKEKSLKPSSMLKERIMTQITGTNPLEVRSSRQSIWIQAVAIAACTVLAIAIGIGAGRNYVIPSVSATVWNINDSQIENLALYETGNE